MELVADVHRTLGQWDEARMIYRTVLDAEPQNVSVLLNLGAYHFRKADFAVANEYFLRAARAVPPPAGAFYDLSLSYSETYQFEESRKALAQAKEIDAELVDHWVRTPNVDRVLTFNGGLGRRDEIRRSLLRAWAESPSAGPPTERAVSGWASLAGAGLRGAARRRARSCCGARRVSVSPASGSPGDRIPSPAGCALSFRRFRRRSWAKAPRWL